MSIGSWRTFKSSGSQEFMQTTNDRSFCGYITKTYTFRGDTSSHKATLDIARVTLAPRVALTALSYTAICNIRNTDPRPLFHIHQCCGINCLSAALCFPSSSSSCGSETRFSPASRSNSALWLLRIYDPGAGTC